MKTITIILIGLLIFSFILVGYFLDKEVKMEEDNEERLYQGPVRPTDDEDYFRKTGITRPLEIKE